MININAQEIIFNQIGRGLPKKLNVYCIGGTAMMLRGLKGETHEFGGNLLIKIADPSDILIMKSVTGRAKDNEDIISIINNNKLDWNTILQEAQEQVNLGNKTAIFSLGEKLERLTNKKAIAVPKNILDRIANLHNKSAEERGKNR